MRKFAVLLAVLIFVGCQEEPPDSSQVREDGWAIATFQAEFAIQAALQPAPSAPDDNLDGVCNTCGGDGVLGDGRIEIPCPDCSSNQSQRLKSDDASEETSEPDVRSHRVPRLLIFSASWCPPCAKLQQSIGALPETWTRGKSPASVIQCVDVSTTEQNLQAREYFGVDFDAVPAVFAYWSKEKHKQFTGPTDSAVQVTKWFNRTVASMRSQRPPRQPLLEQLVAELHRVTNTKMPAQAIDVDVSDRTASAPAILAAMSAGSYSPSPGVTIESESGLFPTRTIRQSDGTVRLHFDQRPKLTAKKWMLRIVARVQWLDISSDGRTVLVSLSGFPDIRLKL
ncbi:MAG: hypothetical protein AB8G99_24680 [Planctomycetaceae bacterium]